MSVLDGNVWAVAKFGGSSVASAARWTSIAGIVDSHVSAGRRVLVVCSALASVTDRLTALDEARAAGDPVAHLLEEIERLHLELAAALDVDGPRVLSEMLSSLARAAAHERGVSSPRARAALLAHGELLSSRLGAAYLAVRLADRGGATVVDARSLLAAEAAPSPSAHFLSARCPERSPIDVRARLADVPTPVAVTQGFIARGTDGETVLLGRGGSDASAAYMAAALEADVLEIWSDVPGLFTADPRVVPEARLLRRLDYGEAHMLSSLGARALHPRAIEPCRQRGITLHLGWTARPDVEGTRIGAAKGRRGARAITSRREVALIAVERTMTWQPVGFLAAVSSAASQRQIAIDLIASAPAEIRLAIDVAGSPTARAELDALIDDLRGLGKVTRWSHVGSVSAVGARSAPTAFLDADPRLVAHAADRSHVSVVVDQHQVPGLTQAAHHELFGREVDPAVFGPRWRDLQAPAEETGVEEAAPCRISA